jgi:hypothetical protein
MATATLSISIHYLNFFNSLDNLQDIIGKISRCECSGDLVKLKNSIFLYLSKGELRSAAQSLANRFGFENIGYLSPNAHNFWNLFPAPP